jgi:hypothetical protein
MSQPQRRIYDDRMLPRRISGNPIGRHIDLPRQPRQDAQLGQNHPRVLQPNEA